MDRHLVCHPVEFALQGPLTPSNGLAISFVVLIVEAMYMNQGSATRLMPEPVPSSKGVKKFGSISRKIHDCMVKPDTLLLEMMNEGTSIHVVSDECFLSTSV